MVLQGDSISLCLSVYLFHVCLFLCLFSNRPCFVHSAVMSSDIMDVDNVTTSSAKANSFTFATSPRPLFQKRKADYMKATEPGSIVLPPDNEKPSAHSFASCSKGRTICDKVEGYPREKMMELLSRSIGQSFQATVDVDGSTELLHSDHKFKSTKTEADSPTKLLSFLVDQISISARAQKIMHLVSDEKRWTGPLPRKVRKIHTLQAGGENNLIADDSDLDKDYVPETDFDDDEEEGEGNLLKDFDVRFHSDEFDSEVTYDSDPDQTITPKNKTDDDDAGITNRYFSDDKYLCESTRKVFFLEAAENRDGVWKFIVNLNENFKQGVRAELCSQREAPCKHAENFPPNLISHCVQKYMYRLLVAYNHENHTLYSDNFKIPSSCVCAVLQNNGQR